MNRDQIITLVLRRCGNRETDTVLAEACELELDLVILEEEEQAELPWFLITEWATANIGANDPRVQIPGDFLLEVHGSHLYWTHTDGKLYPLVKEEQDDLKAKYRDTVNTKPEAYALLGRYFHLFPIPDVASTVWMQYYGKSAALTDSNLENVWTGNASDLLVARLGEVIASQYLKDPKTADRFAMQAAKARDRLARKETARDEVNRDRYMGDD